MSTTTPLPVGVGYGVVVGIGFFFALVMSGISWIQVAITPQMGLYRLLKNIEPLHQILDQNE